MINRCIEGEKPSSSMILKLANKKPKQFAQVYKKISQINYTRGHPT